MSTNDTTPETPTAKQDVKWAPIPQNLVDDDSPSAEIDALASQLAQAQRLYDQASCANDDHHRFNMELKQQLAQAQQVNDALLKDNVEMSLLVGAARSQLAQAQGEAAELRDKLETYDVVVAEMREECGRLRDERDAARVTSDAWDGINEQNQRLLRERDQLRAENAEMVKALQYALRASDPEEDWDSIAQEKQS